MTICKVQILCLLILAMPGELLALRQCEVMAAETEAGLAHSTRRTRSVRRWGEIFVGGA